MNANLPRSLPPKARRALPTVDAALPGSPGGRPDEIAHYDVALIPFVALHLIALAGLYFVGFTWWGLGLAVGFYYLRMFGITAGYHRYFAHRAYKTSRAFQFVLAFIGTTAVQKGVLWWAAHHRDHHKYSDKPEDIHSPRHGFLWSHTLWFLSHNYDETKWDRIKDFRAYPELVWLNQHYYLVPTVSWVVLSTGAGLAVGSAQVGLAVAVWLLVSTVLLWHGTFSINSFTHIWGKQRYETGDDSRNSLLFALLTMGEGWHNNHHYYQSTANNGFFWWEIDLSYYALKLLSVFGIVWDLRKPPAHVLAGGRKGPAKRPTAAPVAPSPIAPGPVALPVATRDALPLTASPSPTEANAA